MKNGILSGWLFLAVIFFRELDASIILYRPDTIVLSVIVYSNFIDNVWGQLCVVGVIMTLISYALGLIIIRLTEPERLLVS
jgi:ABC-type Fe3+ transport system permease subunit